MNDKKNQFKRRSSNELSFPTVNKEISFAPIVNKEISFAPNNTVNPQHSASNGSKPRGTPSVNAFLSEKSHNDKVMETLIGGPVPNIESSPNSAMFTFSPEVRMNNINKTLNPMLNQSKFPLFVTNQQGEDSSVQIDEAVLFDRYADLYKRQGMLAMEDTIGRSAALTGGYGNSYAETAGNQAYDSYIADYLKVINGTSQSVGSGATGSWLDGLIGDQPSTGFTGTTAQEAQAYVQSQGLPADSLADLMSDAEWRWQKALHSRHGGGGVEVTDFDTYAEYLAAFVAYATEMYSG